MKVVITGGESLANKALAAGDYYCHVLLFGEFV